MEIAQRERLQQVFDVLDDLLGDTDPHTDVPWHEWDDDDLKVQHPLLWCCRQLSDVIGKQETEDQFKKRWEEHWAKQRENYEKLCRENGGRPPRIGIDEFH